MSSSTIWADLLGLAIHRAGVLATLDQRIAMLSDSKSVEAQALVMVT